MMKTTGRLGLVLCIGLGACGGGAPSDGGGSDTGLLEGSTSGLDVSPRDVTDSGATGADVTVATDTPASDAASPCIARCVARALDCGAPRDAANAQCASICARNPTESQLRCLEAHPCAMLAVDQGAPCFSDGGAGADR